jgi:tetratricopeptide (TPR) repeat protein
MCRAARVTRWTVVISLALLIGTAASTAGRLGKDKEPVRVPGEGGEVFQLQSQLIAQVPAVQQALEAVRARPQAAEAWQDLAKALTEAGDREDAIRALETAVEIAPNRPELWVDLGAVLIQSGEVADGMDALEEALDIEPFQPLAHYNMGIAYQQKGEYENALDAFEAALRLAPELGDPKINPGVVNNPDMPIVKLRIYMKTTGAAPAIFSDEISEQQAEAGQDVPTR